MRVHRREAQILTVTAAKGTAHERARMPGSRWNRKKRTPLAKLRRSCTIPFATDPVGNFYTSYVYDAVPLTSKQKYTFAIRETLDLSRLIGSALGAGIEQANDSFKGYGYGAAGYGKRYAALYGDGLFSDILSHAVFPTLFKQDPRYFYQGSGSARSRFIHAVSFAVVIRSDSGRTAPNYSYLLADLGAGSLSNLYYPHADRGPGLVFTDTAIGMQAARLVLWLTSLFSRASPLIRRVSASHSS